MLIYKYSKLFHKYILKLSNHEDDILYTLKGNKNIIINKKKHIIHLHIFNIELFDDFYEKYYENISDFFTIFITYIIGEKDVLLEELKEKYEKNELYFIHLLNKGYDVGPKIVLINILEENNINYESILFLHSKTNNEKRYSYFYPLIGTKEIIKKNINLLENDNIGGIFPNIYKKEDHDVKKYSLNNLIYFNQIVNYYDLHEKNIIDFSEGNCLYLHKNVINFIFKNKTKLWYNLCNTIDSFDENWIRKRYNKPDTLSLEDLYNDFTKNSIYFKINNSEIPVGNDLANPSHDMPDGMFEHVWERLWVNFIHECKMKYFVSNII